MEKATRTRCVFLTLALSVGLTALSGRLVYLQYFDRARYEKSAGNSYKRTEVIQANRGVLLDRDEEIIATTVISKSVVVDLYHLKDVKHVAKGVACAELRSEGEWRTWNSAQKSSKINARARKLLEKYSSDPQAIIDGHVNYLIDELARPLGMSEKELRAKLDMSRMGEQVIYHGLASELAVRLEKLIKDRSIKGVFLREEKRRWYPAPELATHVVGYVNRDGRGLAGVESSMNGFLEGTNGYEVEMRDIRGNIMPAHKGSFRAPNNGLNVQLTIDMGIQAICEEELDRGMEEFEGVKGCVVMMKPDTGEVLAMASRPHFNLNLRQKVVSNGFNYALQAIYEPGSTFKIVAAAGALNEGLVSKDTTIYCHWANYRKGRLQVKDHHPYGDLPVWKVIQKSSNIGAFKLAQMQGKKTFFEYAKNFGFGKKTEVRLAGESRGLLVNTGNEVDFSRVSYGYAVSVTPLQVANAYCVIANGGKLMQPQIVKSVDTNAGVVIEKFRPKMLKRVISEETAESLRDALKTVVATGGTATRADVPGFTEGGKTGTARKHDPVNGGHIEGRYTVSFAGMLPAENPAFVCIVVVDDPQTTEVKRYGGTIAAPIWKRIAERTAAHMHLTPTEEISHQLTKQ
ncbi:peptidoglycan D,D-transpeptidase FtsI family protein [Rubritalea marina]|uniref:peptidoglycan D,D-transpeptidase FtsI family protein n=1 Tax=Rubritalea marina TaxID=361055 RepID=UPI00037A59E2|nr:penicillin-binding protein 2 [Rubritalea marina]